MILQPSPQYRPSVSSFLFTTPSGSITPAVSRNRWHLFSKSIKNTFFLDIVTFVTFVGTANLLLEFSKLIISDIVTVPYSYVVSWEFQNESLTLCQDALGLVHGSLATKNVFLAKPLPCSAPFSHACVIRCPDLIGRYMTSLYIVRKCQCRVSSLLGMHKQGNWWRDLQRLWYWYSAYQTGRCILVHVVRGCCW